MKKTLNLFFIVGVIAGIATLFEYAFSPAESAELQIVDIGSSANDGTGDTIRSAFVKVNTNFWDLWATRVISINGNTGTNITVDAEEIDIDALSKVSGANVQAALADIDGMLDLTASRVAISDSNGDLTTTNDITFDGSTMALTGSLTTTDDTGIGTASPGSRLEVREDQASLTSVRINNDHASGFTGVELYDGETITSKLQFQNAGHLQITTELSGRDILVRPAGVTAMTATAGNGIAGIKPEHVYMGSATINSNRLIHINKTFDDTDPGYAMHATIQQDGAVSTAGINMKVVRGSDESVDHIVAFQGDVTHGGSGDLTHLYGSYNVRSVSSTGNVASSYGDYFATPTMSSSGVINTNYGIFIEDQVVGDDKSFSIYSEGGNAVFMTGYIGIDTTQPQQKLDVNLGRIAVSDGYNIGDRDGNTGMFVSSDNFYIQTAGGTRSQINSSGLFQTGDIQVKAQNEVQFADADSSNYVSFKAASTVASDLVWTLPSSWGSQGQVLVNSGSGVLTWDHVHLAGTWTPSLKFGGASTGMTYTTQEGAYFRIGDVNFVRATIVLSAKGSSTGTATITGLSDAAVDTPGNDLALSVGRASNMASLTSNITATVTDSGTSINLYDWGASGTVVLDESNFTDTTTITISGVYQIE